MTEAVAAAPLPAVTVIGEALIDLVQLDAPGDYRARPGGPFNVAVGLARLGHRTELMARLADNTFGRMLRTPWVPITPSSSSAPSVTTRLRKRSLASAEPVARV